MSERKKIMRRIVIIAIIFVLLVFVGTFGYMFLENTGFWMGMYLTIITVLPLATVISSLCILPVEFLPFFWSSPASVLFFTPSAKSRKP